MMMEDDISYRCVLLKSLPFDADEATVRACLRAAPGDLKFEDKVERIHPIEEDEETKRWIVLFDSSNTAMECREKTSWTAKTPGGITVNVFPDYCSECIIPDEWTQPNRGSGGATGMESGWVMPDAGIDPEEYRSFPSIRSDELFMSSFQMIDPDEKLGPNGSRVNQPVGKFEASRKFSTGSNENFLSMDMFGGGRSSADVTPFSSIRSGDMYGSGRDRSDTGRAEETEGDDETFHTGEDDTLHVKGDADAAKSEDVIVDVDSKTTKSAPLDAVKCPDIDDGKVSDKNIEEDVGQKKVDTDKSDQMTGDIENKSGNSDEKTAIKPDLSSEGGIRGNAPVKTDVADGAKNIKANEGENESQEAQNAQYATPPVHSGMPYLYGYPGGPDQIQQQFPYGMPPNRPVSYFIHASPPMDPRSTVDGQQAAPLAPNTQTAPFAPETQTAPFALQTQAAPMPPGEQQVYGWAVIPVGQDGQPIGAMPGQADFPYGQPGPGLMMPPDQYGYAATPPGFQPYGRESHNLHSHERDGGKPSPMPRKDHDHRRDGTKERQDEDGINFDEEMNRPYADLNAVHAYFDKSELNAGKGTNKETASRASHVDGRETAPRVGGRPPMDRSESTESTNRYGYSKAFPGHEDSGQSNDGRDQASEGRKETKLRPLKEVQESIYDMVRDTGNGSFGVVEPKQLKPQSDLDKRPPPKLPPRESAMPREPAVTREPTMPRESNVPRGPAPITTHSSEQEAVKTRPVKIYVKKTSSVEDSPETMTTASDGGSQRNAMIKVYHVPEMMSKETLELFFENKKSGGGPIKHSELNARKGEAIIEFERHTDVQAVLDKQAKKGGLVLSDRQIRVVAYTPPPMDQHKVFLSGMSPKTSRESLELYMEACTRRTPTDIVYGDTAGTAMVTFPQPIDLATMRSKCASRPLEGKTLELSPVEVTRSIKVKGYRPGSLPDILTIYFENERRSSGGPVESTDLKEDECAYIVTFANAEDAVNVCGQSRHVVDDYPLGVRLYYPCLDLDPDTVLIIPDPIVLHDMDIYLTRYFGINAMYRKSLEERLEECHGRLVLPADKEGSISIECTVKPTDEQGRKKVRDWTANCKKAVDLVCSILTVNDKLIVGVEVWSGVIERLASVNISHPDYVTIFRNIEEHGIVVVGQTAMAEEIVKQIDGIVTSLEQAHERDQQNITKSKMMRTFQMALLRASRFMDEAKKEGLDVSMDNEKREVLFKGTKKDVDSAMGKMRQTLQGFVKQSVPGYKKTAKDLLFEKETRDYIKGKINKKRIIGVWDVVKGEDLLMYGRTEKEVETAVKVLQSCLKQKAVTLDWNMEKLIKSEDGKAHILDLEEKNRGFMKIDITVGQLLLVAVDFKFEEIENQIMEFFDMHGVVSEFMSVDKCKLHFIRNFQKTQLENIEKQYSKLLQRIEAVEAADRTGFKIHGQKAGCKLAIDSIRKLVDSIIRKDHTLSMPGIDEFMRSPDGLEEIQNIQIDNACVIKVDAATSKMKTRASSTPQEKAYYKADYILSVVEGHLTSLTADVIVNPSHTSMKHNTGVGAAIVDKGGFDIQKACSDHERKFGPLTEGDTFLSNGGLLPCQHVIHVIMPIWKGGVHNEQKLFKTAIQNCLGLAQLKNFRSIAFPVMGVDEFHFEMGMATKYLVEEIDYFFRANKTTGIAKVMVCVDPGGADELMEAMNAVYKKDQVVQLRGQTTPMPQAGLEVSSQEGAEGEPAAGGGGGMLSKEIKVSLVVGELAEQKVDVMVNSTNHAMEMSIGNASKALLKAGGDSIQKECKDWFNRHGGLQPGVVVDTRAGNLPCKYLFHGVLTRWDGGQGHAEKVMKTFMERCLSKADEKTLSSIAFPALGTGNLGFPADKVAQYIYECVESFQLNNPTTTIGHVLVVLWKGDTATVKAFQAMEKEKKTDDYQTRKRVSSYKSDIFMSSAKNSIVSFGEIEVEVVQGDLTQEKTGGIVNSVQANLDLSMGLVSNAILKAAGQSIQTECDRPEHKRGIVDKGLVVTGPGKMFCKKIIHLRARNGLEGWRQSVHRCLSEAEFLGLNSLSFPALGTGGKSFSPEDVAKVIFTTIRQYTQCKDYQRTLKRIRVVLFKKEMVGTFVVALRDSVSSNRTSFFPVPEFLRKKSLPKKSSVTVHIYKNTSRMDAIIYQLDGLYLSDELTSPLVYKLQARQESEIRDMGMNKVEVGISQRDGVITLKGYRKAVSETKAKIDKYLKKMSNDMAKAIDGGQGPFPSAWTRMSPNDPPRAFMMLQGDTNYSTVVGIFSKDSGISSKQILKVERIQNPTLYTKYFKRKCEIERLCFKKPVVRTLWHGIDSSQLQSVINNGFQCSSGAGPKSFGVQARTVLPTCHPDSHGHKHIILASVLTGHFMTCSPGKVQKPLDLYNSVVDNPSTPTIFHIFDDLQAYPLYCITFL